MNGSSDTPVRVLIAGFSTRALAESAVRAAFDVTAIDAFDDLDQHPSVRTIPVSAESGKPFGAPSVAERSRAVRADAVTYSSNFENHPSAVSLLSDGRQLWGNPPDVLRRVRDPLVLSQALSRRGLPVAETLLPPHRPSGGRWLIKPIASGGGRGVREWTVGNRAPGSHGPFYFQRFIEGVPGSMVFVANGRRAVTIGFSRQIVGERDFGADGHRYCGNILTGAGDAQFDADRELFANVRHAVDDLTDEFGLTGVNGVDFIARGSTPYVLEVNPRWCASMELVERAYGLGVFAVHAAACREGTLPDFDLVRARESAPAVGKAIVFARHAVTTGDTRPWLDSRLPDATPSIRDIPRGGEYIAAGRPVCTVFAAGVDGTTCLENLVNAADCVYRQLASWRAE
jgi:predicted ATP-grasp superfamily ATP-dependent carboligase